MKLTDRVRFIEHKGVRILLLDFSSCTAEESVNIMALAKMTISSQPEHSLLILSDFTDAHYNPSAIQEVKDFVKYDAPYIKASAVIGLDRLKKIFFDTIVAFIRKDLRLFDKAEEAKDWLIEQNKKTT